MVGWTDEWINGWMDGWDMDEWMDGWMYMLHLYINYKYKF